MRFLAASSRDAIVLIRLPWHGNRLEIKRVSGIAGDSKRWLAATEMRLVPPNHVYLVSDNGIEGEGFGADSRTYGPVEARFIVARIFLIVPSSAIRA